MAELYLVFDVESVGLHGEGFAVGAVLVGGDGAEHCHFRFACDPEVAQGTKSGREWVAANVPALAFTHANPRAVRDAFWAKWLEVKGQGAVLAADCAWPVEANFLRACVEDVRPVTRSLRESADGPRDWEGPYPLVDVASVRLAVGLDPLATVDRLPNESPQHDPLADARQSARLLIKALTRRESLAFG